MKTTGEMDGSGGSCVFSKVMAGVWDVVGGGCLDGRQMPALEEEDYPLTAVVSSNEAAILVINDRYCEYASVKAPHEWLKLPQS